MDDDANLLAAYEQLREEEWLAEQSLFNYSPEEIQEALKDDHEDIFETIRRTGK